jgi:hypothetical protein
MTRGQEDKRTRLQEDKKSRLQEVKKSKSLIPINGTEN